MDRRDFLQKLAGTAAGATVLPALTSEVLTQQKLSSQSRESVEGYTVVAHFSRAAEPWKVYEDLRSRDGSLIFVSSHGEQRVLRKSAEASMHEGDPPYLGLQLKDIGLTSADLLAERLLPDGDPDLEKVKSAAPPLASAETNPRQWTTFVGTKEAYDVTPVYYGGGTRTYHPGQYAPELHDLIAKRRIYDGLVGGWMPAVRKIIPVAENKYWEIILFGDVEAHDKYIVQTWHRTALIENGSIVRAIYGYSYPAYPPARKDPEPESFYRALIAFAEYWDQQLQDFVPASLPQQIWIDMSRHAFAKELMTRPGGVYPKYGAVDRDYAGSEYDGFQDIFTSAIHANMEWGRLETTRAFIDNYFSDFVDAKGMVNMRGPETTQFGITLSLLVRYFNYTDDRALMLKHRRKIEATAKLLCDMHDESLRVAKDSPGYGLIAGWDESDSCLSPKPSLYWQPYYANSAWAARGLKDIAQVWPRIAQAPGARATAQSWLGRSKTLQDRTIESIKSNIERDKAPPYIGLFPGTKLTFRESLEQEHPSPQQWPHRAYAELLHADVLPPDLANLVIDCMRAHGATTLGVVANVGGFHPEGREILGFISYGYAQALLRLDRIEEFLLFLYSHRYHVHTRGSWTAGEVTNITGDSALYCVPAQQTIPPIVRWMLVLEDSDDDRLYLAKGLPRDWLGSGKEIRIEQAPTRWGRVAFNLVLHFNTKSVVGTVELAQPGKPKEVHLKLRLPSQYTIKSVSVNGRPAPLAGLHNDTVAIATGNAKHFEVVGRASRDRVL